MREQITFLYEKRNTMRLRYTMKVSIARKMCPVLKKLNVYYTSFHAVGDMPSVVTTSPDLFFFSMHRTHITDLVT